ncbi:hypothetical protein HK098_004857 [Nowakowskiella sp. JEL0407]|nr:hypothetical protein HK098_004857 [Nowakowskiella sp. JEL0407]
MNSLLNSVRLKKKDSSNIEDSDTTTPDYRFYSETMQYFDDSPPNHTNPSNQYDSNNHEIHQSSNYSLSTSASLMNESTPINSNLMLSPLANALVSTDHYTDFNASYHVIGTSPQSNNLETRSQSQSYSSQTVFSDGSEVDLTRNKSFSDQPINLKKSILKTRSNTATSNMQSGYVPRPNSPENLNGIQKLGDEQTLEFYENSSGGSGLNGPKFTHLDRTTNSLNLVDDTPSTPVEVKFNNSVPNLNASDFDYDPPKRITSKSKTRSKKLSTRKTVDTLERFGIDSDSANVESDADEPASAHQFSLRKSFASAMSSFTGTRRSQSMTTPKSDAAKELKWSINARFSRSKSTREVSEKENTKDTPSEGNKTTNVISMKYNNSAVSIADSSFSFGSDNFTVHIDPSEILKCDYFGFIRTIMVQDQSSTTPTTRARSYSGRSVRSDYDYELDIDATLDERSPDSRLFSKEKSRAIKWAEMTLPWDSPPSIEELVKNGRAILENMVHCGKLEKGVRFALPAPPSWAGARVVVKDVRENKVTPKCDMQQVYTFKTGSKFTSRLRKGIPHIWRGHTWYWLITTNAGLYNELESEQAAKFDSDLLQKYYESQSIPSRTDTAIHDKVDITFRNHVQYYHQNGRGYKTLFRVLKGISACYPDLDGAVELAHIAALFLTVMEEERCFLTLVHLLFRPSLPTKPFYYLRDLFIPGTPGIDLYVSAHNEHLEFWAPNIKDKLSVCGIEVESYLLEWVSSLFLKLGTPNISEPIKLKPKEDIPPTPAIPEAFWPKSSQANKPKKQPPVSMVPATPLSFKRLSDYQSGTDSAWSGDDFTDDEGFKQQPRLRFNRSSGSVTSKTKSSTTAPAASSGYASDGGGVPEVKKIKWNKVAAKPDFWEGLLPFRVAIRCWDLVFIYGWKIIPVITVAILRWFEDPIMDLSPQETLHFLTQGHTLSKVSPPGSKTHRRRAHSTSSTHSAGSVMIQETYTPLYAVGFNSNADIENFIKLILRMWDSQLSKIPVRRNNRNSQFIQNPPTTITTTEHSEYLSDAETRNFYNGSSTSFYSTEMSSDAYPPTPVTPTSNKRLSSFLIPNQSMPQQSFLAPSFVNSPELLQPAPTFLHVAAPPPQQPVFLGPLLTALPPPPNQPPPLAPNQQHPVMFRHPGAISQSGNVEVPRR